jgi:hypothetical protein
MEVTLDCLNSMAMHGVLSQLALISLAWNHKLNVKDELVVLKISFPELLCSNFVSCSYFGHLNRGLKD